MSFKNRLKELRTSHSLSVKDFADSVNMSRPTISNYEAGRGNPSEKAIQKIAETYNVSVDWLKGIEEDAPTAPVVEEAAPAAPAVEEAAPAAPAVEEKTEEIVPVVEKKKRGRKKKEETATVEEITPAAEATVPVVEEKPKKRGRKKKEVPTPVVEEATPAAEEKTEEKPKKRGRKKATPAVEESTSPNVIIESMMGGQISVSDILTKLPEGVEAVYVKPGENKAFFTINDEVQSIDLW